MTFPLTYFLVLHEPRPNDGDEILPEHTGPSFCIAIDGNVHGDLSPEAAASVFADGVRSSRIPLPIQLPAYATGNSPHMTISENGVVTIDGKCPGSIQPFSDALQIELAVRH